ncbi:MAG: hypothetical protein HPZ91_02480 [Lentisphaeria bacterium]|nr:hypothetical protein [Lentisphaeria bacterium]
MNMNMISLSFAAVVAALLAAGGCAVVNEAPPADRTFRNFSGVCHGNTKMPELWGSALGWDRMDISWQSVQPERGGTWDMKALEKFGQRVLAVKARGAKLLPILDYGSGWTTENIPDREFDFGGRRYSITRRADGDFDVRAFNREPVNGKETLVPAYSGKVGAKRMSQRHVQDDQVEEWRAYVRKVVSFLRQEPYNVEYFQVWNEAHPTSSFWYGDMDTYMRNVHLPAAKVIRELGGKVVYGGWICGAPVSGLVEYLDRHNAWDSFDVIDIHYFPLAGMEYLKRAMDKRGFGGKGLWQTELGFSSNPNYIGNLYPRILFWALENDWDWADKYKLFYFAFGSPDDRKAYGFGRSLMLGNRLNFSGRSLETLAKLLAGGPLERYAPVRSTPELKFELNELASSMESFRIGNRIVTAAHVLPNNHAQIFVDWNGELDTLHLDYEMPVLRIAYPEIDASRVAKAERVSMYGSRTDLTDRIETSAGGIAVGVPIREPDRGEFKFTDMPEDFLPQVFYTVITLK